VIDCVDIGRQDCSLSAVFHSRLQVTLVTRTYNNLRWSQTFVYQRGYPDDRSPLWRFL